MATGIASSSPPSLSPHNNSSSPKSFTSSRKPPSPASLSPTAQHHSPVSIPAPNKSPTTASASPPANTPSPPSLPPLITSTSATRRISAAPRPPSYASRRMSSYQGKSTSPSRPTSHVFPMFHSSLPYTLVRDFAYPTNHPYHYGPPPQNSGLSTPASETRRLSDPAAPKWEDPKGPRSAPAPWTTENTGMSQNSREQLPAMTFSDGGPPYSEDEDLHSPVVTTSRHRKSRTTLNDRGRSPGASNGGWGVFVGRNGDGSETYYQNAGAQGEDANGPGGEIVTYPVGRTQNALLRPDGKRSGPQRNSHFAASIQRKSTDENARQAAESDDDFSEADDESRFSRNYQFTIASPDEEMHGKAVALFDFQREHENELPLTEGQIILVSYRQAQGWLVAQDPKTGESGLVPEEFVRLVRDIEGGLNGLSAQMDDLLSPASDASATPTVSTGGFAGHEKKASNGSNPISADKHPPVQSNFSTSSKDLEKYPLQKDKDREKDENSTPTLQSHPLRTELAEVEEVKEDSR